ncbi:MAG: hypothetical protein JWO05_611 [Gemmatimonadetes bacterium]|nr:hypothetical protein [Gemmatimonadota bacterium]
MKHLVALAFAGLLASAACATQHPVMQSGSPLSDVSERALRVYRESYVIDTHNDLPDRIFEDRYNPDVRHGSGFGPEAGNTDFPRLVESQLTAVFLAAFIDADYKAPGVAWPRVLAYVDTVHAFAARHPDHLRFAASAADIRAAKRDGKVAILVGVEGGHAIENSLEKLAELQRRGVRYMTLTWNNGNDWAGSSIGVAGSRKGGLTDFGRQVVHEMNRLGILVDLSHVSDSTFFDAVAASSVPVIASHSSARALANHPRNLSDDQLRALAKNGGVANVNFYDAFIDERYFRAKADVDARFPSGPGRLAAYRELTPTPLAILIDHIDHIVQVAGIDHVGIGSDFDGVGGHVPAQMEDVTRLPRIAQALLDRGYSEADVKKVLGGNMLRVMDAAIDHRP